MLKEQMKKIIMVLVAVTAVCGSSVYARSYSSDVLVVPSRFTIIQLAFDIVALRDVNLISYDSSDNSETPVLYVWDKMSSAWENLTVDEFSVGSFSATTPNEMILVGSDSDLPASLISGASQAKKVTRIDTINAEIDRIGHVLVMYEDSVSEEGEKTETRSSISVTTNSNVGRLMQAYVANGGNPFDISPFSCSLSRYDAFLYLINFFLLIILSEKFTSVFKLSQ